MANLRARRIYSATLSVFDSCEYGALADRTRRGHGRGPPKLVAEHGLRQEHQGREDGKNLMSHVVFRGIEEEREAGSSSWVGYQNFDRQSPALLRSGYSHPKRPKTDLRSDIACSHRRKSCKRATIPLIQSAWVDSVGLCNPRFHHMSNRLPRMTTLL